MTEQAQIAAITASIQAEARLEAGRIADRLEAGLAAATPVDTGRTRKRWERENRAGGVIVIGNSGRAIRPLNDGSSSKAPARFVEREIAKAVGRGVK